MEDQREEPIAVVQTNGAVKKWPTVTHTLIHPIPGPDGEITEVVLREPDIEALERVDDLGIVEGQPMKVSHIRGIIAALSDLPDEVIKRIHRDDFSALGEKSVPLLAAPEPEGKKKKA